jgi:hypothetical protein
MEFDFLWRTIRHMRILRFFQFIQYPNCLIGLCDLSQLLVLFQNFFTPKIVSLMQNKVALINILKGYI